MTLPHKLSYFQAVVSLSLKHIQYMQRVGRCPTEWRLGWYGEGALCWESNEIRVFPPTTYNQSRGSASSPAHNYNQPYSPLGLSSLFLIIDYHSTVCTQLQRDNGKSTWGKWTWSENVSACERYEQQWAGRENYLSLKIEGLKDRVLICILSPDKWRYAPVCPAEKIPILLHVVDVTLWCQVE